MKMMPSATMLVECFGNIAKPNVIACLHGWTCRIGEMKYSQNDLPLTVVSRRDCSFRKDLGSEHMFTTSKLVNFT